MPLEQPSITPSGLVLDTAGASPSDSTPSSPATICPTLQTPTSAVLGSGHLKSSRDGDLLVFITARPNPNAAPGASTVCHRDGFGRPVVAHTNVHAPLVTYLHSEALAGSERGARAAQLLQRVLTHELMHVLALQVASLYQFRDASRRIRSPTIDTRLVHGSDVRYLVTPHSTYALRAHYAIGPLLLQSGQQIPGMQVGGVAPEVDPARVRAPPRLAFRGRTCPCTLLLRPALTACISAPQAFASHGTGFSCRTQVGATTPVVDLAAPPSGVCAAAACSKAAGHLRTSAPCAADPVGLRRAA